MNLPNRVPCSGDGRRTIPWRVARKAGRVHPPIEARVEGTLTSGDGFGAMCRPLTDWPWLGGRGRRRPRPTVSGAGSPEEGTRDGPAAVISTLAEAPPAAAGALRSGGPPNETQVRRPPFHAPAASRPDAVAANRVLADSAHLS